MSIFPDSDYALGQLGALAFFNNIRQRLRSVFYGSDYASLQSAIDATKTQTNNGGVLNISPGRHMINEPLIIPRTGATPQNVVHLIGAGRYQTTIYGSDDFPAGRALIEWEDVPARAWEQRIQGIGFELPNVPDVKAIHYRLTDNSSFSAIDAERAQISLENLYIIANNDYHPVLIKIEGINIGATIRQIEGDPQQGNNATYDTLLLEVDSTYPGFTQGGDSPGLFSCDISQLYGSARRGGYSSVFRGRLCRSRMADCFGNGGKNDPSFTFVNSISSTLENLSTEGQGEKPQFLFDRCEFMDVRNFGVGTPDAVGDGGIGNGIELIGCNDNQFDNRWADGSKPSFSARGVRVISVDADSRRNRFTRVGIRSAGIPADEFSIAGGVSNEVHYFDFQTNSGGVITGT